MFALKLYTYFEICALNAQALIGRLTNKVIAKQVVKKGNLYNGNFLTAEVEKIVNDVKTDGCYSFEEALHPVTIQAIVENINFDKVLINENDAGVVSSNHNKFLSHCLACSEEVYKIITSDKVLQICNAYFDKKFRLVNHRVYQTNQQQHLLWHTDNNKHVGSKFDGKHSMRGLLFMFYLTDVSKNPFQFLRHSHKISEKYMDQLGLSHEYIKKNYCNDVVTFKMKKGSFILCDSHGLHRAEPFNDKHYSRTTLLFQVDEVGEDHEEHGEKNLINTAFLQNLTPELMQYLGFGQNVTYPTFPKTSLDTLPLKQIISMQRKLVTGGTKIISRNFVRKSLPASTLAKIKQAFRKKRNGLSL